MTGLAKLTLPFPQIAAGACSLALLASGFAAIQTYRMHVAHVELSECKGAKKQAAKDQAAVNHEPAAKSAEIARQSDATAPAYYQAAADAADAHRVRVSCPSGRADLPRAASAAPLDDGPAGPADMVSRPKADDDKIVHAAARMVQVYADTQALIAAGVAVASDNSTEN